MLTSSPTIPEVVFERIKSDITELAFNFFQDGVSLDVTARQYKIRLKASGIQALEKTPATNAAGRVTFVLSNADKTPLNGSEYQISLVELITGGERTIVTGTLRWSVPSGKTIGLVNAPDVSVNYIAATGSLIVALGVVDFGSSSSALSAAAAAGSATLAEQEAGIAEDHADAAISAKETAVAAKDTAVTQAGIATTKAGEANTSKVAAGASELNAKASENNAKVSENNAFAYKTAAQASADAALIQSGVYTTEALGRAAVADGQAFKVQGSGDVAAYEYRRTNSTTSVLIASYPNSDSVNAATQKSTQNNLDILSNRKRAFGEEVKILSLPMAVKRYTAAGVSDTPSYSQVKNVDNSFSITNYTDSSTSGRGSFFDTLITSFDSLRLTLSVKITNLRSTAAQSAIGFGTGVSGSEIGLSWRGDGSIRVFNQFTGGATIKVADANYAWALNDVLTIELFPGTTLGIRITKNSGASTAILDTGIAFTSRLLLHTWSSIDFSAFLISNTKSEIQNNIDASSATGLAAAKAYSDAGIALLSPFVAVNTQNIALLVPATVITPKIRPSSTSAYTAYAGGGTGNYKHISGWYFAKTAMPINQVSIFFYKLSTVGLFTTPVKVEVLHDRAGTVTKVCDTNIPTASLAANNPAVYSGVASDYELKVDFNQTINLLPGDKIFAAFEALDGITHFTGSVNYLLSSGEWNDGTACYRAGDQTGTPAASYTTIPALPAGVTTYQPFHFYYKTIDIKRVADLETAVAKNPNKKLEKTGFNNDTVMINGAQARIVTSDGYDFKGEPDHLMIICHGNGQDNSALPSTLFRAFCRANKITLAIINTQEQSVGPYTTSAVGWGNPITLKRNIDLYQYLMQKYNLHAMVMLSGQSMGGLAVGHFAYTRPFPIRFCLGIGPVPSLKYMFTSDNYSDQKRKTAIRAAYGMRAAADPITAASVGPDDANLDQFIQGFDWRSKNSIFVAGVEYKTFGPHIYLFSGLDGTFTNDFGGEAKYNELKDAINRAGGYCTYQHNPALNNHAHSGLYDDALAAGVFLKELGLNSGTTAQRPVLSSSVVGYLYFDTTLSVNVTWNGSAWV